MELYILAGAILLAVIIWSATRRSAKPESTKLKGKDLSETLPYRVKDNFLTAPELKFYSVLCSAVGPKAVVCPKVGLKDFLFVSKHGEDYMKYLRKISQKHIDFLLCAPDTMRPVCGIELDDSSHERQKTKARDEFVEKVYRDAKFPLVRIKTKASYTAEEITLALGTYIEGKQPTGAVTATESPAVLCPKCQIPMTIRTARNSGEKFYGCSNYPNCRETAKIEVTSAPGS